ncbi:MAG: Major facilitator superfamily 1 [Frankiales bacterium]|nr:Major facilitator superfamily 1 [Frankiales bacterium]
MAAPWVGVRDDASVTTAPTRGAAATALVRRAVTKVRAAASADGADRSGLAALLWAHALQAAGDALVAVALASTAFFQVSAEAARGKIALFLLLTLLPFSFLVPVAGPLLDRFPHGRRNVLALTTGGRGLIAWTLAGSLASLSLYPQVLAILVMQRAYGVARAAAVIRVRPPALGLVASNARLNVAALASSGVAAAAGVGLAKTAGSGWDLRVAAVLFLAAAVASLRLPSHVDDVHNKAQRTYSRFSMGAAPVHIRRALAATVSLRAITGLLTLGLAILLKAHKASPPVVALVLGAAVAGALLGTALASRLSAERTARLTAIALLAPMVACLLAAISGTIVLQAMAVGLVGLGASLGKYALDAALQTHVPAEQTGSAFALSETALQLGWAVGGALGLGLSLVDGTPLGETGAEAVIFAVATLIPVAGLVLVHHWKPPHERPAPQAA